MDSKVSEKEMRETYSRAFGKEFDSNSNVPLKLAYNISVKKLRRENKIHNPSVITDNEYYGIVNHFVYFCLNFNTNFLDAFKGAEYEKLKSKFWLGYDKKGFYSSVIYLYLELNNKEKMILSNWIYENYKGEKLPKSIDNKEYFTIVNHFVDFCLNYPEDFLTWLGTNQYEYFEAKWNDVCNSSNSYSCMIKFWMELSESNRKKIVDGIIANYNQNNEIDKKSLGGFVLGAALGVAGYYLYSNSTIDKENGKINISVKEPEKTINKIKKTLKK